MTCKNCEGAAFALKLCVESVKTYKDQIEKMKCCDNCKHYDKRMDWCKLDDKETEEFSCVNNEKWEMKE